MGARRAMTLGEALFRPRTVALIGASGDAAKNTARPQRYLRKHGYSGRIVPVNPGRKEVLGETAYPTLAEAPVDVDHAFIMVEDVEAAIEDCGRKRVPVASIYSDGFADAGPRGVERQKKLVETARAMGVRLLGPNSMGVVDIPGRLALTVNAILEMEALPPGGASIVSQSGTMLGTVLSRGAARGLGFAKLVSVGNECDLGVGELAELLADDPDTRVILLFLETIRDAERLARAAHKAHSAGKPVVAYKLGRSALGEALARSHTGALAGADAAVDAYFRDCGIVRVDLLETLIEVGPLLQGRRPPDLARAGRVAVVTTTGGGAAAVVDRLGVAGIEAVGPRPDDPIHDLTMTATPRVYQETLEKLLESPQCDAVLATVGSSAQFHPGLAIEPIVAASAKRNAKPLGVFLTPHAERSLALLAQHGIAAFRTPEACADAFAAYFSWMSPRNPPSLEAPTLRQDAFELVEALGIPVATHTIAHAPDFAHAVPYPVAVKMLDAEHKTEVGGVALDVPNQEQVLEKIREWGRKAILVQKMEHGLAEAIVGYRDDPVVGPLVLVGAGGTLAELYRDYALALAPVTAEEAERMIERVKGLATVRGYRNLPRGDVKALARAVSDFSRLALVAGRPIAEAEINPLMVKAHGVVAVDARLVLKG
ncbi:MAG TPA: acetate--CoA ligase family protein [Burkholderiales bacterium]|nr:acetate--CoA ligase family protein [Burkholderiales bacterium]